MQNKSLEKKREKKEDKKDKCLRKKEE